MLPMAGVLPQWHAAVEPGRGQPTQLGEDDIRSLRSRGALGCFRNDAEPAFADAHSVMALDVQSGSGGWQAPVRTACRSPRTTKLALRVGMSSFFEQLGSWKRGPLRHLDRRHAVRLTSVTDTSTSTAVEALKIGWSLDDALPFALDPGAKCWATSCWRTMANAARRRADPV